MQAIEIRCKINTVNVKVSKKKEKKKKIQKSCGLSPLVKNVFLPLEKSKKKSKKAKKENYIKKSALKKNFINYK